MSENREQIIAKVQKLYNLAEGEKKIGNHEAANSAKGMADKLKVKYSVTEIEIKGNDYTYKQTTSTAQNKNYASAEEAAEDIFNDIFGRQRYGQSKQQGSYNRHNAYSGYEKPKTYRYQQQFSYSAQYHNEVKEMIASMLLVSGAEIETFQTEVLQTSFFGSPKRYRLHLSVTGDENSLTRFKKVFQAWANSH